MELYRIDYFAADLCPSNSQGGKVRIGCELSLTVKTYKTQTKNEKIVIAALVLM